MANIETTVRCFRRQSAGDYRRGIWLMHPEDTMVGLFFHGSRNEVQDSRYGLSELIEWSRHGGFIDVDEITPAAAIAELKGWPEAQSEARVIFARYQKEEV